MSQTKKDQTVDRPSVKGASGHDSEDDLDERTVDAIAGGPASPDPVSSASTVAGAATDKRVRHPLGVAPASVGSDGNAI